MLCPKCARHEVSPKSKTGFCQYCSYKMGLVKRVKRCKGCHKAVRSRNKSGYCGECRSRNSDQRTHRDRCPCGKVVITSGNEPLCRKCREQARQVECVLCGGEFHSRNANGHRYGTACPECRRLFRRVPRHPEVWMPLLARPILTFREFTNRAA